MAQSIVPVALILLILVMVGFLLVSFGLIDLDEIRYRPHALIQHGDAARAARDVINNCSNGLSAYNCPSTSIHPSTYLFVCPLDSTKQTCAGMYVGTSGAELTSWIMSCTKWYAKATVCVVH